MLNELYDLAQKLKQAGVTRQDWHPQYKPLPKGIALLVALDTTGQVASIRMLKPDETAVLRKWEPSNGRAFPGFNVPPLWLMDDDEASANALAALRKRLKAGTKGSIEAELSTLSHWPTARHWLEKDSTKESLSVVPQKLCALAGEAPPDFLVFPALFERVGKIDFVKFHRQLSEKVLRIVTTDGDETGFWLDRLIAIRPTSAKKKLKDVSLVLEVSDSERFEYPVQHAKSIAWINQRLISEATTNNNNTETEAKADLDAFGENAIGASDKFAQVNLPMLGKVILRAMTKDAPCQARYGVIEANGFPAGKISRREMKSALEWLGASDRRGKTWCGVGDGVLFAYPSRIEDVESQDWADFLGATTTTDSSRANFEARSQRLMEIVVSGKPQEVEQDLSLFVLTKPDGHRTKVLINRRSALPRIRAAAQTWQASCRRGECVQIRVFEDKKPKWITATIPQPMDVVTALNTVWSASEKTAPGIVKDFNVSHGISLLLDEGNAGTDTAQRALRAALKHWQPLLLRLAAAQCAGRVLPLPKKQEFSVRMLPCMLALLALRAQPSTGELMESPHFLIGRVLALADQLHIQYCKQVRKDDTPSQLIGNALMSVALEQPVQALALLTQRILPYQAWAQTWKGDGGDAWKPKYFLQELGRISYDLVSAKPGAPATLAAMGEALPANLPLSSSDSQKAELLLGYLARKPKTNAADKTPTDPGENS